VDGDRFVVSDAVWEKIASLLPGKASDSGVTAKDNRLFLEAVLWRIRTGSPWRDLPQGFGRWNSVLIVCSQSTKGVSFAIGSGRDHITDLDVAISDDNAVHQQFEQLPLAIEVGLLQPLLHAAAELLGMSREASRLV
jgi:hypothetical protein